MLSLISINCKFSVIQILKCKCLVLDAEAELVVHAAGPFQQVEKCTVLEAAISTKVILFVYLFLGCAVLIVFLLFVKFYSILETELVQTNLEVHSSLQTAYLDVCDDTNYAQRAKSFHSKALAAGIPAVTTGGIYPGVSNGLTLYSRIFSDH